MVYTHTPSNQVQLLSTNILHIILSTRSIQSSDWGGKDLTLRDHDKLITRLIFWGGERLIPPLMFFVKHAFFIKSDNLG